MPHPTAPINRIGPRPVGRPPLPDEVRLYPTTIRLTKADAAKLHALGGRRWLLRHLTKAKV